MKHHRAVPVAVRIFVLALALSSLLGAGALAQDGDQVVAGPTTPVPSASPAASQAPSASAQASPSVEGSPAASGLASVPDVTMRGSVFQPVTIEVTAGETVDWFNDDVTVHTVTALDGSFNSGVMVVGASFSVTFATPGTIDYICAIHPLMTGSVVVSP